MSCVAPMTEDVPFSVEVFQNGEGFHCYAGHKLVGHGMAGLIPHGPKAGAQQVHDLNTATMSNSEGMSHAHELA